MTTIAPAPASETGPHTPAPGDIDSYPTTYVLTDELPADFSGDLLTPHSSDTQFIRRAEDWTYHMEPVEAPNPQPTGDIYGSMLHKLGLAELDAEVDPTYGHTPQERDDDRKSHAMVVTKLAELTGYNPQSFDVSAPDAAARLTEVTAELVNGYQKFREAQLARTSGRLDKETSHQFHLEDRGRQILLEKAAHQLGQALFGSEGNVMTRDVLEKIQDKTGISISSNPIPYLRVPIREEFNPVEPERSGSFVLTPDTIEGRRVVDTAPDSSYFVVATPYGRRRVPIVRR